MKSLWFTLALALAIPLATAAPASAQGAASIADESEVEVAGWVKRLDDAKARLDIAQHQLTGYENEKSRGAARRYPRGDAKVKYLEGIRNSAAAYEAARIELPALIEEARQAGIEPGVLDPYETAAAAAVPVTELTDDAAAQANPGDDDVEEADPGDEGVDDNVTTPTNTDTSEAPATNTDTQEEDPGPQTDDDSN